MDQEKYVIAIDGPAGSGKSTVAREVAKRLGISYLDSGAYYRALTLHLYRVYREETHADQVNGGSGENSEPGDSDSPKFSEWVLKKEKEPDLDSLVVDLEFGGGGENKIYTNGEDVSAQIRTPEITEKIKYVADKRVFRDYVNERIRKLSQSHNLVMDGRDIGTEVFPDTPFKFFLTASAKVRAERRMKEMHEKGMQESFERVYEDMVQRDRSDENRKIAPLKKAKDAILVDTDSLSIKVVIETILSGISVS